MADYDFFDLTGLPFDQQENPVAKKVRDTIEKKKKELGEALGTAIKQIERDDLNGKIAFLNSTSSNILSLDGKQLTPSYAKLAQERVKQEQANLAAAAALLSRSGASEITSGSIRMHKQQTKLSQEHVEEVFRKAGFKIKVIDPLKAIPKFPMLADRTYAELEALRKARDTNPNGPDVTKVSDLYAFAAYLKGEPENAAEYRSKPTPELASLFDGYARQFSTRNDNLGKLCAGLVAAGKAYVFNSEDNRRAYNTYLQYKSPALASLFASMRLLQKVNLKDPKFAEECIKQICAVFSDYEVALAIYNTEAGLKDDPYEPVGETTFYVKCAHCQNFAKFKDIAEAHKNNQCPHCKGSLYRQCKRCKKPVLVSAERCPECGFVFASPEMFGNYFAAAQESLRNGNFAEARQHLAKAQAADPGEKARTDELSKRIDKDETAYEKPLQELRELIAKKSYRAAALALQRTISSFPRLNVTAFETQIRTELTKAQSMFEAAKRNAPAERANACLDILDLCVDFTPAMEFLRVTPPLMDKNIILAADSKACRVTISWTRSGERGVTYRIVRKAGKDAPKNEMDGELLKDGISDAVFCDGTLLPGTWYSYAVFAKRKDVCSQAATKSIVLLADVTDVHYEQTDKILRITWTAPKNCTGVSISRASNGKDEVIAANAHGGFEDKGIEYGKTYSYTLCAQYYGEPPSDGVRFVATISVVIGPFTIDVKPLKGNVYHVTWDIKRNDVNIRVLANKKTMRDLKSTAGGCDIELPTNEFYTVEAAASSGGNWIASKNSVQINMYQSWQIDKESSQVIEKPIMTAAGIINNIELRIKLSGGIPSNATAIWYVVRTKASAGAQAPWADAKEIASAPDVIKVSIEKYKRDGELLYTSHAMDEDSYYLTLFTLYNVNGKEILSAPFTRRFSRPLSANIFWKVSKPLVGNRKLSIEILANRPLTRQPKLLLCACPQDQHLLSHTDAKGETVMAIRDEEIHIPIKTYKRDFELDPAIFSRLKNRRLFLFEADPTPQESYIMRWAEGFSGKA